ncbi:alcohol dehydrogenase catalytic domain-containing protein [Eubacteriales bacterium OttesenSCG-928-N14]|nr:alcohol dehydrogenase catalytic domain-containing protein [Eubacteriales bacterium OttesenSCG-928-N14]
MKAIVYRGENQVALQDVAEIVPKKDWCLIRVSHAGICGSDMTIYQGKHPRAKAPLIPGHEFSGYLCSPHPGIEEGKLVTVFPYIHCGQCEPCRKGNYHVCANLRLIGIDLDGGMAEYVQVPCSMVQEVPQGISPALAAFIEPVGISVHAARQGGYLPGENALIFGAGAIGLATAITLTHFGAGRITVVEPNEDRLQLARQMGFDVLQSDENTLDEIYRRTDGNGEEFVFDCAGHQSVIDILPDAVAINGAIIMVAGYKTPPRMNFQKGMFREFALRFVRNCTRRDFEIATRLIADDPRYGKLLNCILQPQQVQQGFDVPNGAYKVLFTFEGEV